MALNPSPSNLDQQQILQRVMDSANDALRVDANVTATIGEVTISADTSTIAIEDPVTHNILKINADGSVDANVNVSASGNDSILAVGTEDGTLTGTQKVIRVDNTGALVISGSTTVSGTVNSNLNGLNVWQTSQASIGTSAVQLTPTPLPTRSSVSVKALTTSNNMIYVGSTSAVTTSNGYALFNGDSIQLDLTAEGQIWAISGAAGQSVFILELGS